MARDRFFIYCSAGCRACAVGLAGVVLSLYLLTVGFSVGMIGVAVTLGLAGSAAGAGVVMCVADRVGRRLTLAALTACMTAGGIGLAYFQQASWAVLLALTLGMVNGMGRDRGGGLTVEQAMLPQTAADTHRTTTFAWYNLSVETGHAVGALLGVLPALLRDRLSFTPLDSYRLTWVVYAGLCGVAVLFLLPLSRGVELRQELPVARLSKVSRPLVARFAALSGLDSFGGGFLTTALLTYWFFVRFGVDEALLGPMFFLVRFLNGMSHLGAAWCARRIGLVNTMVWSHLPSSLILLLLPLAPNVSVAITIFLLRELLVEMDVPTRQSYLVAIVKEEERTWAGGITNLVRTSAWAVSPMMAGALMQGLALSAPLIVGSGIKVIYDVMLFRAFRHIKPPEECKETFR